MNFFLPWSDFIENVTHFAFASNPKCIGPNTGSNCEAMVSNFCWILIDPHGILCPFSENNCRRVQSIFNLTFSNIKKAQKQFIWMVRFPLEFRVFERNVIQRFHTQSCSLYCLCWDLECDQGWNENSERAVLSCELSTKQWGNVDGHFHWTHCVKWGKIRLPLLNTWVCEFTKV